MGTFHTTGFHMKVLNFVYRKVFVSIMNYSCSCMTLEIAGAMFPIFGVFQVSSYGGKDTKQSLSRGGVNISPKTDGEVMDTE